MTALSPYIMDVVACPQDHSELRLHEGGFICERGHEFRIEDGVPVFIEAARHELVPGNMPTCEHLDQGGAIDSFVNDWVVNTNGNLYWGARGNLHRYPIPRGPFSQGQGRVMVDVGCSWGRWSVAAARTGFRTVGLDVHVDALAAAYRVSRQLGFDNDYLCAGAEQLPFRSASVDMVFSYSVLQHLDRKKVRAFFKEAARVLKPGGTCLVQLPNVAGLYNVLLQAKRSFRDARPGTFEMRYWSRSEIRDAVAAAGLEDLRISADGFLSQNPQLEDLDLIPIWGKLVVLASYAGRRASHCIPGLTWVADSLWVEARASGNPSRKD